MFAPIGPDLTLVLTACIDPKGMPGVSRPNPEDRERDYIECLRYYLAHLRAVRRLVFVENSGWPLARIQRSVAAGLGDKSLEFLSLDANDYPRELGKSFGELHMLDHALAQSQLVAASKYVGKLTARNFLRNLEPLLERVRRPFELLCDVRDHPLYDWLGLGWSGHHADTRFFVCTPGFYRAHLAGTYSRMTASYSIEALLFAVATRPELGPVVIRRFPIEPDYAGLSGHVLPDGTPRDYSAPREVLKRRLRSLARRLTPWLHV